jgi:hypothetical protein
METQTLESTNGGMTNNDSTVSTDKHARPRRQQSRSYAERITRAENILRNIEGDSELSQRLAAEGITSDQLAEGATLQQAAQAAFVNRQRAIGAMTDAIGESNRGLRLARQTLSDFRISARSMFPSPGVRDLLDLDFSVPQDTLGFFNAARTTYTTAMQTAALSDSLTVMGYPQKRLQAALDALTELGKTMKAEDAARGAADYATQERLRAVKAMDRWVAQVRAASHAATRGRKDLKIQLGL